jgi:hypothetical protein
LANKHRGIVRKTPFEIKNQFPELADEHKMCRRHKDRNGGFLLSRINPTKGELNRFIEKKSG